MSTLIKISPSILSADFSRLADQLRLAEEGGADMIHADVMDGHFVPNLTIGPVVIESLRAATNLPIDVHLMIERPEAFIGPFADAGADRIAVHTEATHHVHGVVQAIKERGVAAGVAVNPGTPISSLDCVLELIDFVLVMSVNPGFGGQPFINGSLAKVRDVRDIIQARGCSVEIEVDGGVTADNAEDLAAHGAEVLVAGAAVFKSADAAQAIRDIRRAARSALGKTVVSADGYEGNLADKRQSAQQNS